MFTRKDYLDSTENGFVKHRRYFGEIVKEVKFPAPSIMVDKVIASGKDKFLDDPHMNYIHISEWDHYTASMCVPVGTAKAFKIRGETGGVSANMILCLVKEAVRQKVEKMTGWN